MKKTYKKITFTCTSYDEMIEIYQSKYEENYYLISYRLTKIIELEYKAVMLLFPKKGANNQ